MDIFEAEMVRRFVVAVEKIANALDHKTEPQTDCDGCRHYADKHTADTCYECKRSYTDCYVPQAEREGE